MITIEEALQIINQQEVTLNKQRVPLKEALNHYLAEEVYAPFDIPSFDNSAMDGYAVSGNGRSFEIIGEAAAGNSEAQTLQEGQAIRIFTGAKIPENTTSVVMQEHVQVEEKQINLQEELIKGKNIRKQGGELKIGEKVFTQGHRVNPASIGMLGSLGLEEITVFKKPKIDIIATGNELIQLGSYRKEGQIFESNTHTLLGALNNYGWESNSIKILSDDLKTITNGITESIGIDVIILSGGISVGDYDFVKQALERNGVEQLFYKVLQKPGKPLYFGRISDTFVFALPGNPASSLTCFYIYVLPLLKRLSGGKGGGLKRISLPLSHNYHFKFDRPTFLKSSIEDGFVSILDGQGSSMLHSMAMGNALVFLDKAREYQKREPVPCIIL